MVFEAEQKPDWRCFYTAVSRASSLRQAWVYVGKPLLNVKEFGVLVERKVAGYKEQDRKVGRDFKEEDYITSVWVKERLKAQN